MNYDEMSNEELYELLKEELTELDLDEVNDFNRKTVIACLKLLEKDAY